MDTQTIHPKLHSKAAILLSLLVCACFAGNFFAPKLFIGPSYLLGNISILLSVTIFGIRWGVIAGLAAAAGTLSQTGQHYAILLYLVEPACVGWLISKNRNRNIILCDAIFWPFAGVPLLYILLHLIQKIPLEATLVNLLALWIIGITNAVIASLLLAYIPFQTLLGSPDEPRSVPIHHLIFNMMMAIVLLPTIVVLIPFGPFKQVLSENISEFMMILLGLNMLALVTALYTSHRLAEPLRQLSNITTDLPERLMQGKATPWPDSRITEIDQLSFNFRSMATALGYKFQEITYYSETLETRVRERTKELTKTNNELTKEISERIATEKQRDELFMELRQKNEELEGIVYVASHDLRSPLVNVQGFSRKLANSCEELESLSKTIQLDPEKQQRLDRILHITIPKSLRFISSSTEKMGTLLNGLLRLSRLGHAALCFDRLNMNSLVENIVASMTYQIDSVNASIELNDLSPCLADAGQVTQVFSNLLDNAIKYRSPDRPLAIKVFCEEHEENVRYCVEDNGIGIPENHKDRIWEIFHRLNPNDTQGDGLGLTLARQIISRLGGSIRVESEIGVATRFYVTLPMCNTLK